MVGVCSEREFVGMMMDAGFTGAQIRDELIDMGWHPRSADEVLQRVALDEAPDREALHAGPDLSRLPSRIEAGGRKVNLLMSMRLPRVSLYGGFLSDEECDELIALSLPRMQRSKVIVSDGLARPETTVAYARTSEQTSYRPGESTLVDDLRRRAAELTRWPEGKLQNLLVARYRPGADFSPHHDYFSANAHPALAQGGQRVATLLLYLNTPERGGATAMLDVELDIYPQRGNALLFSYPEPREDTLTLHAGVPLCEGDKWIATFFLGASEARPGDTEENA